MSGAATQRFSREFDAALARLPSAVQTLVLEKIAAVGLQLDRFPHYRMTGRDEYRLRIGDYRVIYDFDRTQNLIDLITLGHRREIYRES